MIDNPSPYGAGRRLIEIPLATARTNTPRYGVRKLPQPRYHLPLLVTGNGRSGTTSLSYMLRQAGFDCGHEHCGKAGTVSWYFFTDSDWHPYHVTHQGGKLVHTGERRSDFTFAKTVHLVRHPLKVIGSIAAVMSLTDHRYVVDNSNGAYPADLWVERGKRLLKTMHLAHTIWTAVEKQADARVRLEDMPKAWPRFMKMLGADPRTPMPQLPAKNRSRGIYKALTVSWSDLCNEDETLAKNIMKLAHRFGYDV